METVTSLRSERPARNEEKKMMLISSALLIILYGLTATWAQVISFPRCNNSTVRMEFVYANPSAIPYDLFSPTRRSTCGKRAGTLTGSGSYADPYVISVDLSKGLNNQSPDCGITQTGVMTYTLTMIEMQSCEGLKTTDRNYTVSCTLYVPIVNTPITTSTMLPLMTMNYNANYTCQPPKAIIFHYKQTSLPPYDIYAKGKETTCSKSAGLGSGTGITGDPYILRMDGNAAVPDCGMTELGYETYSVLVHVQQVANVITGADITYLLTCNFTLLSNNIITSATLPVKEKPIKGTAYLWQASAILYVTSEKDYSALSTFDVGDPIRLVAQLGDGPATGLRVRDCKVRPGPGLTPILQILDNKGCSTENNLVPPFEGESPYGSRAKTGIFGAFKFPNYDTVFFECVADFCYSTNDLTCLGSHCSKSSRRKREAANTTVNSRTISAFITVRNSANQSSDILAEKLETSGPKSAELKCWDSGSITPVALLGGLWLLTLLICIFLGVKLRGLKSQNSKLSDKNIMTTEPAVRHYRERGGPIEKRHNYKY